MREKNSEYISHLQGEHIGRRFAGASLSTISLGGVGEKQKEILNWISNGKNFLVYLGAPGIGKTYFCSALIPWVSAKFRSFRYWNERDFFSRLRGVIASERGDFIRELDYMLDDEFMMFDDLGSSSMNDWRREMIFETVDRRYGSESPTVFTSNLTKKEISESLGPRTYSRLFAKENLILEFHGAQDLRQSEPAVTDEKK